MKMRVLHFSLCLMAFGLTNVGFAEDSQELRQKAIAAFEAAQTPGTPTADPVLISEKEFLARHGFIHAPVTKTVTLSNGCGLSACFATYIVSTVFSTPGSKQYPSKKTSSIVGVVSASTSRPAYLREVLRDPRMHEFTQPW